MPIVRDEALNRGPISGKIPKEPITGTNQELENLIRRLQALEPGRRYLITLTAGAKVDYTVLDLGRVER